jgi:GDPmannose 4,6-dehydratase
VVSERQALLYHSLYGTPAIISRAFNHEGPGRGDMYVTSAICKQVVGGDSISLGNVNSFRDWSHVRDIARGYIALAEKGVPGRVYVQGSGKMHSVLSFALLALRYYRGDEIASIESMDEVEFLESPLDKDCDLSSQWAQNALDDTMIRRIEMGEEMFPLERTGVVVAFENSPFMRIFFDVCKWRPVDVPLLLASPNIHEVGVEQAYGLNHIIAEMIDYYEENTPRRSGH